MLFFKKKAKTAWFKVTYHEVNTADYITEELDGISLLYLQLDCAFIVDEVIPLD